MVDYAVASRRPLPRADHRRALAVLLAALVLAAGLLLYLGTSAAGGTAGGGTDVVTVRPGDSLWSIAAARTDGDVRDVVDRIVAANHLAGASVHPGQQLVIPPG